MSDLVRRIDEAVNFIRERAPEAPEVAMILGSGLGALAGEISGAAVIPYGRIPHFKASRVPGHAGNLVLGALAGRRVVAMQGRAHFYEGHTLEEVTFPVRVMARLGAKSILVTNAAGGIRRGFRAGDLMLIADHINALGTNPLRGDNDEALGPRFPDMTAAYDPALRAAAAKAARRLRIPVRTGVYLATVGPTYETPAEIRAFRTLGADAVGMSVVPETIVARHMGLRVLGISCITNLAAGVSKRPLDHEEVIETTLRVRDRFMRLVREVIREM